MVAEWLTNSTRFCINENFPTGSPSHCYWGLPSISADDSAYDAQGYWRGYVWGPMGKGRNMTSFAIDFLVRSD